MNRPPYQHAQPQPQPQPQRPQQQSQQPPPPKRGPGSAPGQAAAQGYAVGNPAASDIGRTILVAAISAAAGAVVVRMLDRYLFTEKQERLDELQAQVGALRDHIAAQPQVVVPAMRAPVREYDPAEFAPRPTGMTDDFWQRLSEGY